MKRSLFVDSSAWYALADREDVYHDRAAACLTGSLSAYARFVTTNHVVGESYTLIRMRLGHAAAQQFLRSLEQSHKVELVFVAQDQEEAAFVLLRRHADQEFSFVDATSFVVMKALGIRDAFTFDHHFATLGFAMLPSVV